MKNLKITEHYLNDDIERLPKTKFTSFYVDKKQSRGNNYSLTSMQIARVFAMQIKRVYYITGESGNTGQHCHYKEQEIFICAQGAGIAILDWGKGLQHIPFEEGQGFFVPNFVWHGFTFLQLKRPLILIALSSTIYDPSRKDYLEDYKRYLQIRDKYL